MHCINVFYPLFVFDPSNAEAYTFVQSTRTQIFENDLNPGMVVLIGKLFLSILDEYPCARVSVIFQFFLHHFALAKLATSSIWVTEK